MLYPSTDIRLKKQFSVQHPLSKGGDAAPKSSVDISSPPLEIDPLTSTNSTAEIVQNIISQLLGKIVEGSYIKASTKEVLQQKTSNLNNDLKIYKANEKVNIWKKESKKKTCKFSHKQSNCLTLSY